MVIKSIRVLSLGKVVGSIYAGMGLIFGGIFSLFSIFGAAIGSAASDSPEAWFGLLFGVGAVIILPLFYGIFGFLGGLLTAAIYNLVANVVGGLEFEVE